MTPVIALALSLLGTAPRLVAGGPPPQPGPALQAEPVRVVATLPVYADITRAIGGAEVEVFAIADPNEDAHFVRPKPSFALELRRADLFITTGLDLELWVPALLDKAGNSDVLAGAAGYVTAYTGIQLRDVPTSADRSQGDIHIFGNPHIYTDPLNAIQIARNIATGLKRVAPERSAVWDAGVARFSDEIHRRLFGDRLVDMLGGETLTKLAQTGQLHGFLERTPFEGTPLSSYLGGWLAAAASFRGEDIICYHKNWAYLENRFQVNCVEYVEAKPGIPPTPGHVAALIDLMQRQGIDVLIAADYFAEEKAQTVAARAGAAYAMMPLQPGGAPGIDNYFDMVDAWVTRLANAFASRSAAN